MSSRFCVRLTWKKLLEGKDGRECREHYKNCAPCHLPIDGTVHPELTVMPEGLPCFVCGEKKWAATMLLYDQCQRDWHMACLRPPFTSLPYGQWICPRCRGSSILGASTNRTYWSCVVFIILCLPKCKMRSYGLETLSTWGGEINFVKYDGQTSEAIKDGLTLHPTYSSLEWRLPH